MKTTLTILLIAFSIVVKGQTLDSLKFKGLTVGTSIKCDTCKWAFSSTNPLFAITPKPDPSWTFHLENSIMARLTKKDANGQQTGWFDKRYIKITSDSTFVVLPKSK